MEGRRASPPDGRTEREKLWHAASEQLTIIAAGAAVLRLPKVHAAAREAAIVQIGEATTECLRLFDLLRVS